MPTEIHGQLTAAETSFAIVVSRFNDLITKRLLEGAIEVDGALGHGERRPVVEADLVEDPARLLLGLLEPCRLPRNLEVLQLIQVPRPLLILKALAPAASQRNDSCLPASQPASS